MKIAKKLLSMLLAVLMLASIIPVTSIEAEAATTPSSVSSSGAYNKIYELFELLGDKSFFTTTHTSSCGTKSSSHSCSYCKLSSIITQTWFKNKFGTLSTSQFPKTYYTSTDVHGPDGRSCFGFATFAEWYIFSTKSTDKVTTKYIGRYNFDYSSVSANVKTGDLIRFGANSGHSAIVISYDSTGIKVLDCNWGNVSYNCQVQIHTIRYGTNYSEFSISRATNSSSSSSTTKTYTILYNANGGTGAPASQTKTHGTALTLSSTKPTRIEYTFLGWSTNSTATTATYSAGGSFTTNANTTLYAVWRANTYTIVYNGNGNTGGSTSASSHKYNSLIAESNIINYTAYEFMQTGHDFSPIIDKYGTGKYFIDFYLYADVAGSMRVYFQNGSTSEYAFMKEFDATTSWKRYTFVVDVELQDSSVSQSMLAFYGGYGTGRNPHVRVMAFTKVDEKLTANGFTKTGYSFLGWSQDPNATSATYADGQEVKNLTKVSNDTINLYAVWKPNTYTVVYNGNGSTGGSTATSSHQYNSLITSSGVYYKAYEFMQTGHDLAPVIDKHGTGKYLIEFDLYADVAGPMRVYMQNGSNSKYDWGEKTFDVTTSWKHYSFVVDVTLKDSSEVQSMLAFYGIYNTGRNPHVKNIVFTKVDEPLTANGFTRTGYTFLGWSTSSTATTATYTNKQAVKNLTTTNGGTVTLYAVWQPNTYTVKFNANGGTGTMSNQTYTYGYLQSLSANRFTKQGYSFAGWSTSPTATSAEFSDMMFVQNLTSTNGGTVTLYAVWKANTYTVSYNANGGIGAPSSQTKTYGKTLTLSSTKPTRTGYTFLGWSTSSTATSATYSAGDNFTTNANTTLYAVWKANTYTVSYNANGGTGAPTSQTKTYGKTLTLSNTIPTRAGYTFLGWSTSSTATSATYSAGSSFTTNANTTLYAVWKKAGHDINNDGIVNSNDTGLYKLNGTWYYVKNGDIDYTFTGLTKHTNGIWYYVENGILDWSHTGLVKHTNGIWYYVQKGQLNWNKTGLVKHTNGIWYYVQRGQLNWNKTGLVKHTNGIWYYVQKGQLNWNKTGLVKHTDGNWYYVQKGQINWNYTGLVKHTNGKWYYVQKGKLNWNYTGYAYYNGKKYRVVKGVKV